MPHDQTTTIKTQSKHELRARAAKIEGYIVRLRIPASSIKAFLDSCDRFDYFKFGRHTIDLRGRK